MAYMKLLDTSCKNCTQRARFEVFDLTEVSVGKYCLEHATEKVAQLKKEEMDERRMNEGAE